MRNDRTGIIVAAALLTPLILLLAVAGMTWRAERRMAGVAERVAHDYAAIAVWQYARRATNALHDEVMRTFGPGPAGHLRAGPATPSPRADELLALRRSRRTAFLDSARFAFVLDPEGERFDVAGGDVPALVRERVTRLARSAKAGEEPHRVIFTGDLAIALWLLHREEGRAPQVRAVAAPATALRPVFASVLGSRNLLPDVGTDLRGELALRLESNEGRLIYATATAPGATVAIDSTGLQDGEVRAALDIPAPVARRLLVGGMPASQLPSLGLMILAATALAVVGLVHHRRSRALAEARARFVANVSHELRTPLAQISMFAEMLHLGRERGEMERRQFAGIVHSEAQRLTNLVENVLRASRGGGAPRVRPQPSDLAPLIGRAVAAFSPIAASADVAIEVAVPDGLRVHADPGAFQQVMLNLLDNAVKHGGREARVVVSARLHADELVIAVDDEGPGIPETWRARVFEPFVQVVGRNVAGAGIGLAIVRDLVAAHGGRAWIEASPLGGARSAFTLKRAGAPAVAAGA